MTNKNAESSTIEAGTNQFPVAGNEASGGGDLNARQDLLRQKTDSNRELTQKDIEKLATRIDAFDTRLADQNNHLNGIGSSVNRFALLAAMFAILVAALFAGSDAFGYLAAANQTEKEAKVTSEKSFNDKAEKLTAQRDRDLEQEGKQDIDDSKDDDVVPAPPSGATINPLQMHVNARNEPAQASIDPDQKQALRQSTEQVKGKPESDYSFQDWTIRAINALHSGQYEDAALYWKRASNVTNAKAIEKAQALLNQAVALGESNRHDEARAIYKQLIDTYSPDNTPAIREMVATAMNNMGITLGEIGNHSAAYGTLKKLVDTYSSDNSPSIREQVVRALYSMAVALGKMGKQNEAIAAYKKLIYKYPADNSPSVREQVARAMVSLGATLEEMGRYSAAYGTLKKLVDTYSSDNSPSIREQVARALYSMAVALGKMGKQNEAITTYKKVIDTYSSDNIPAIREQVAMAMNCMGVTLGEMVKPDEALVTYKKLIATYSSDKSPAIREQVAMAMNCMGVTLGQAGKPNEEIATYQKLIDTYTTDNDNIPGIRTTVGAAMHNLGVARLMAAKKAWKNRDQALTLLREAKANLRVSLNQWPEYGAAHGKLAYAQWLLGERQEAEKRFRAALAAPKNGGEGLYRATLDDIAEHPIAEDEGFRAMIQRLWAEYQGGKAGGK